MTKIKIVLSLALVSIAVVAAARIADADSACWKRKSCPIDLCENVYVSEWDAECFLLGGQTLSTDVGLGCDFRFGVAGADACHQWGNAYYVSGGGCGVISWAELLHTSCCSAPCPPLNPGCQEF